MSSVTYRLVHFSDLKEFCSQAYTKVGVPADEAEIIAGLLARSDLRGVETHGVTRLPIYILRLQKGYVRKECQLTTLERQRSDSVPESSRIYGTHCRILGQWKRRLLRRRNMAWAGFR